MTKIGTFAGQFLAGKLVYENANLIILNWDSMTVLFMVLIAPELFKKMMNMKYGVGTNGHTVSSTETQRTEKTVVRETGGGASA